MPVNTFHLRSSVKGKEPTAGTSQGQLPLGSIAINYHQDEPFLSIQDTAGQIRRIAGVKVDTIAPPSATTGEFWLDTSGATKILKVFDGSAWVGAGAAVVDATTSVKGIAQLADAAAVTAGTTGRVVTADQLKTTNDNVATNTGNITTIQGQITTLQGQVVDATTTTKGIVQLADAAAVTAGTTGRVVTADQLKTTNDSVTTNATAITALQGQVVDASETVKGIVELATAAETTTGTDNTRAVHPAGLKVELDKKLNLAGGNLTGGVTQTERTITAGAFDLAAGNLWTAGAIAIPAATNVVAGMSGLIRLTAAPTGWAAMFKHAGGSATAPTAFPAIVPFYVSSATEILVGKPVEGMA